MYWWSDFDPGEVREEFAVIRGLSLNLVRIFLLWDDWQPAPNQVNAGALANLETVLGLAADQGLELDITFFVGHMSGPSWAPGWMLTPGEPPSPAVRQVVTRGKAVNQGYRNLFSDSVVLQASELLVRTVVGRFRDHPAVGLWNLGNEPDLFAWPPPGTAGQEWVRRMTGLIHTLSPETPVTCGLHINSLIENNGLRVHEVFAEVDLAVMHGYPMYADWADGPLDPDFVPFLCALTTALSGKPTLMEEFGGPTVSPGQPSSRWQWVSYGQLRTQFVASEDDLADYLSAVLPKLVEVGALGALLWCYADYAADLYQRPPLDEARHERFFGFVRPDGSLKPHARVFQAFAGGKPKVSDPLRKVELDVDPEEYYQSPLAHAKRLYKRFKTNGS